MIRVGLKNTQAFTMTELLIVVVVIGILSTVGINGYEGYRDRVSQMDDEMDLKVLVKATQLDAYDNDAVPGSLSELTHEQLDRAYASVTRDRQPYTLLAHLQLLLREATGQSTAYALEAFLPPRYYNNEIAFLQCSMDSTPPVGFAADGQPVDANGQPAHSYALNPVVANMRYRDYMRFTGTVIVEADARLTQDPDANAGAGAFRHYDGGLIDLTRERNRAIAVGRNGRIIHRHRPGVASPAANVHS